MGDPDVSWMLSSDYTTKGVDVHIAREEHVEASIPSILGPVPAHRLMAAPRGPARAADDVVSVVARARSAWTDAHLQERSKAPASV